MEKHVELQVNLMMQSVAKWNEWLRERRRERLPSEYRPDLFQANLRGADLREVDLEKAHLGWAILVDANLSGANLREASFDGANLQNANLQRAKLFLANFSRADLRGADLNGSHFGNANLSEANLSETDLEEADFFEANLQNANLSGAVIISTNFARANLREANLSRTPVWYANFFEAQLEGLDLSGIDISTAKRLLQEQVDKTTGDKGTKLPPNLRKPEHWLETKRSVDETKRRQESTGPRPFSNSQSHPTSNKSTAYPGGEDNYRRAIDYAKQRKWHEAMDELKQAVNRDHPQALTAINTMWCSRCRRRIAPPSDSAISNYARFWSGRCPSCGNQLTFNIQ